MLDNKDFWYGIASVIVNASGYLPYIRGILRGHVRPQRITWGIWSILTTIAFVNQIVNGGGYSVLFFGSTVLLVVTVFVLSFRFGIGGRSKFDMAVLAAACCLFVAWAATKNTHITTVIAITIDGVAALPTVFKTFARPETEAYLQWIMAAISGLLSMLAIGAHGAYILYAYPIYVIVMNGVIVLAKFAATRAYLVHKTKVT
ncbi:MAG TPA: hypothetical protein VMS08_03975 [Candidatus Saccharimonadia bacterium]|nr:hypothetical protein [Candidatus Saccharimonadia bacterium]